MQGPAAGTEAGRSTDFNILVHLDRIGDSRLTLGYGRVRKGCSTNGPYVENVQANRQGNYDAETTSTADSRVVRSCGSPSFGLLPDLR